MSKDVIDNTREIVLNDEINRLREEFYKNNKEILKESFSEKEILRAYEYFRSLPSLRTMNLKHMDILKDCCLNAREYFEEYEKRNN